MRFRELNEKIYQEPSAVYSVAESVRYFGGFGSPPARGETTKYMRGWCVYFALALHDLRGFQLIGTVDHFAVRDGQNFFDVRGIMTEKQFFDGLSGNSYFDMSRDAVIAELESGFYKCGYFEKSELSKAKRLVKNLKLSTPITET